MCKVIALVLFVSAVAADRLENTYLPPLRAQTSGGSGSFLRAPSASSYIPPASGPAPAGFYNAPAFKTSGTPAAILKFTNDNNGDGTYRFQYETENHISHQETGQLKNAGTNNEANSVQGSYSYTAPDGKTYTVTYIADEFGFRATGDHIPTPPPIAATSGSLSSGYSSFNAPNPSRQYLAPKAGGYNY